MAAILCSLPCTICRGLCDGCREANKCLCDGCREACACMCGGCREGCKAMSKPVKECCKSPFCFFVMLATALNVPPIALAVIVLPSAGRDADGCRGVTWLLVDMCLCVCNIAAAWYLAFKVGRMSEILESEGSKRTAAGRAMHTLCYDPVMAVYILVGLGFVAWQAVGSMWAVAEGVDASCPEEFVSAMTMAIGFGWGYILFGSLIFACNLCCTLVQ